jgi:hypothetical protein
MRYPATSHLQSPGIAYTLGLKKKIVDPGAQAPIEMHTAYLYDRFGNVTVTTVMEAHRARGATLRFGGAAVQGIAGVAQFASGVITDDPMAKLFGATVRPRPSRRLALAALCVWLMRSKPQANGANSGSWRASPPQSSRPVPLVAFRAS